jgi:hypothetical protein
MQCRPCTDDGPTARPRVDRNASDDTTRNSRLSRLRPKACRCAPAGCINSARIEHSSASANRATATLRLEAEAGSPLPPGRDAIVGDGALQHEMASGVQTANHRLQCAHKRTTGKPIGDAATRGSDNSCASSGRSVRPVLLDLGWMVIPWAKHRSWSRILPGPAFPGRP